ncbi:MAG: D-alanyl-D-alanine carboxypeptidase/D-alanyl-D-alanine-endopeptidase [Hydrogenophilus sp.]|nr:D-alanyl-D-alanine carboxypeptidase/D-alanyl-D-alanine-endopeptidase [Hydrogenophilus sp.]
MTVPPPLLLLLSFLARGRCEKWLPLSPSIPSLWGFRLLALFLSLPLLLSSPLPSAASSLPQPLLQRLADAQIPLSALSLWVGPLDGGAPLYQLHPDIPRNPASVMKLLTTFAALETFGPTHRWSVQLTIASQWHDGTLYGPLILEHSGDPFLTAERLWTLARTARAFGIRRVAAIELDAKPLHLPPADPAAFDGRGDAPYTQPPVPALAHLNAIALHLLPHPTEARLLVAPHPPLPLAVNAAAVRLTTEPCRHKVRDSLTVSIDGAQISLAGRYPRACGETTLYIAPPDPHRFAQQILTAIWRELGGEIDPTLPHQPAPSLTLARSESPTLAELLHPLNKWSNNVLARQLLALIGREKEPDAPDHVAAGARALLHLLRTHALDDGHTRIENGAGLSRHERLTARTLARLLQHISRQTYAPDFIASLPLLGEEGTLRRRFRDHPLRGELRLKSGTLADVRALAGYAYPPERPPLLFILLIDHPNAPRAADHLGAILDHLIPR